MIVKYGSTPTVLTSVESIGTISRMLDGWQDVVITVTDTEGALYATWKDLQGTHIEIKNDADDNYNFVGTVTSITNEEEKMILVCSPVGRLLSKRNFKKNYIYAEGKLKSSPPYAGSNNKIEVETKDDEDFTWTVDQHHYGDRNRGILLLDKTDFSNKVWVPSAETTADDDSNDGWAAADTNALDSAYYLVQDSGATRDASTIFTISGVKVPNGSYVQKIEIEYRFAAYLDCATFGMEEIYMYVYNYNTPAYEFTRSFMVYSSGGTPNTDWYEGTTENENKIVFTGTATQLSRLLKTDDGFTEFKLKFLMNGGFSSAATARMKFDFIQVTVFYETADFSPVMGKITDNGASWLESTDINFTTSSIVEDDSFLIGDNTIKIASEAFSTTGQQFEVDSNLDKYMARYFGGDADVAINAVKSLEKAYLFDYYTLGTATRGVAILKLMLESSFDTVANDTILGHTDNPITSAHYGHDFKIERPDNQYKEVIVYGNSYWGIEARAQDRSAANTSSHQFTITDDTIATQADAQEIAEDTLTFLKSVRPTIKISLAGAGYESLQTGMKVYVTFERPTVAKTAYPIRRIERSQGTNGINGIERTVLYLGMGKTPVGERIARYIKQANTALQKIKTYRVIPAVVGGIPDTTSIDSRIALHTSIEAAHGMEMDDLTDVDAGLSTVLKSAEETSAGAYPGSPVEGELHWDEDEEMLLRWSVRGGAWIEIGGGAGLVGGNSAFLPLSGGTMTGDINHATQQDIDIGGVNKVAIDADKAEFQTDVKAKNGHGLYSYAAGDATYTVFYHGNILVTSGALTLTAGTNIVCADDLKPSASGTKDLGAATAKWDNFYTVTVNEGSAESPTVGLPELMGIDLTEPDIEKLKTQYPDYVKRVIKSVKDKEEEEWADVPSDYITKENEDEQINTFLSMGHQIRWLQRCVQELKTQLDEANK